MKNLDNNLHRRAAQLGERLRCIIVSSVTNAPTIHRPKGESWREFLEYFPQFAREPSPFISRRPSIGVPTVLKYVEYRGDDNNKRGERESTWRGGTAWNRERIGGVWPPPPPPQQEVFGVRQRRQIDIPRGD